MASSRTQITSVALSVVGYTIAAALVTFYLAQNWRLAPNNTDDGLILDYIHQMSLGARPHWDMIDAYGLFNWVFPVTFYKLVGQKVWGVRLWIVILKLISVALAYRTVWKVSNRFYGMLAALGLMVLLGQAWQSLQTAYAFLTIVPLVLGAWHVLVSQPFRKSSTNALVASLLTTLTIWTKLNTGLYLFAGGLFALLCWVPATGPGPEDTPRERKLQPWLKRVRIIGALAYAALFYKYMRAHFELLYFVYLLGPLLVVLAFAIYQSLSEPVTAIPARRHVSAWLIYFATTAGLSLLILFGYYGFRGAAQYARELSDILSTIRYHYPFPVIGKPLLYVGFNENYWTQIPWLLSLLFLIWLICERWLGRRSFGEEWPEKRAQATSIFLLATLHSFALYARSDETHIYQALLLVVPALFVLLFQLDIFLRTALPKAAYFREAVALITAIYASTLTVRPNLNVFYLGPGDYETPNPRLQYISYRPFFNFYVRNFSAEITDRDWDSLVDLAAQYIDSVTEENEPILVMSAERFLHYASRTRSVGGRYAFHFYLISVRLLDRAGFDKIVPRQVIRDIELHPPKLIVTSGDNEPIVPDFPELKALRDHYYEEVKVFRHIHIYKLKPGAREEIAKHPPPP